MRIAFISYEFPPDTGMGGIGTYVKQMASAMSEYNWDVHVFAGTDKVSYDETEEGCIIHRIHCNHAVDFKTCVLLKFSEEHIDTPFHLIESPEINGNAWEVKKKFPSLPLVIRLHAPSSLIENYSNSYIPFSTKLRFLAGALRRFRWDPGYWRKYKKYADDDYQFTKLADHIIAPSGIMKKWVLKNWAFDEDKIMILPNLFNPPVSLLKIPVSANKYKTVIFFGRLNVLKGLVNATRAMVKILKKHPDWRFKIIGEDGQGPTPGSSMKAWILKEINPVSEQVSFYPGFAYEKIPLLLYEGEIVILASLFESFSYTCAEAMAAGKAIVASAHSGMSDMIEHNKTGLLVDEKKIEELYLAINNLITDDNLRFNLATNARKSISEKYTSARLGIVYKSYYESVLLPA